MCRGLNLKTEQVRFQYTVGYV